MKSIHRTRISVIALALVCVLAGVSIGGANHAATAETQTVIITSPFTEAVAKVHDSVVGVSNYQTVRYSNYNDYGSFFNFPFSGFGGFGGYGNGNGRNRDNDRYSAQEVLYATGSGVVIADGYVLTNYHVVEGATSLKITTSATTEKGEGIPATMVTCDQNLDVAILYAPSLKAAPVALGDSDKLLVGDWAICIGNPLSTKFSGTVTAGIVSAIDRTVTQSAVDKYGRKATVTNTMIQVDAAINSGNSGGGMFNTQGELMGVPTLKYTGSAYSGSTVEGIGMCIPINAAKPLIEEVMAGKYPVVAPVETTSSSVIGKPRMGVTIGSLSAFASAVQSGSLPSGVYVSKVEKDGPADKAGMLAGDIIVDVNDTIVTSVTQIHEILADKAEGDHLQVKVYRVPGLADMAGSNSIPDGEYVDLDLVLAIVDTVEQ